VEGTGIHVTSVLDFITHNGPEYYSSIEELDNFYEMMSDADVVMSDIGNGGGSSNSTASKWSQHYKTSLTCGIATSIVGRSVPITNVRPSNRIKQFAPVRRSVSIGISRARDANLKLLASRAQRNHSNTQADVSSMSGKEYRVVTGPYAAAVVQDGVARMGTSLSLLKHMSMYSKSGSRGRDGLGERTHDGTYVGTWKVATGSSWDRMSESNSSSLSSMGAVLKDDDVSSF